MTAPVQVPREVVGDRTHVEELRSGRRAAEAPRPRAARRGTARGSARRSARGSAASGAETAADSVTNASSSAIEAIGLKRRSKPIVVDAAASSSRRRRATRRRGRGTPRRRREAPSAAGASGRGPRRPRSRRPRDRAARCRRRRASRRSGRATARRRASVSIDGETAVLGPVAGRVDAAERDVPDRDLGTVLERVAAGTRPRPPGGCSRGPRARARAGRGPRRGRRGCASRASARCARRAARPAARTSSIAYGGSTTTASPASSQPTRYEAQPRSSFRICAKSTAAPTVATASAIALEVAYDGRRRSSRSARKLAAITTRPTPPAASARPRCCDGASLPAAGSTVRPTSQSHALAVVVALGRLEDLRAGARARGDGERERRRCAGPRSRPPVQRARSCVSSSFHPAGGVADASSMPGGALTSSETVAWGGRSFGISNAIVVFTSPSTNGGVIVTCAQALPGSKNAAPAAPATRSSQR